jgi:hypothetical protein
VIYTTDAELTSLGEVETGSLVLGFGYGQRGCPFLVSEDGTGTKALFRLQGQHFTVHDDYRTTVLSLGIPILRFDASSSVAEDTAPANGTLMITKDGPGVFEATIPIGMRGGLLTLIDGKQKPFYPARGIPAFSRWEIGHLRDSEFVCVGSIDAVSNDASR